MGESRPTRAQLSKMIGHQGVWLALLTLGLFALTMALIRKGIVTWDDLANVAAADG
jgi:hypothetical protein